MSEYRKDLLSPYWVIIASDRARRPSEFVSNPIRQNIGICPFCAGNENETPHAVAVYPFSSSEPDRDWQVRVVPNKYPAIQDLADSPRHSFRTTQRLSDNSTATLPVSASWFEPGAGAHEVIIESREHTTSFTELTPEQAWLSMVAYRDRLQHAAGDNRFRYGLIFKNCRGGAGATLEHSHSQLMVTARIPAAIEYELRASCDYHGAHHVCLYCAIQQEEVSLGDRIVAVSERFVALCPFASRVPFETWILPRMHRERYEAANLEELAELAQFFQLVLRGLERVFTQVPYNYWIHTAPFDMDCRDHYHWHIELFPRVTNQAGFEWGAGCFVNPVSPEESAWKLRQAIEGNDQSVSNH